MKNIYFKKTICAALAGIILAMAGCGSVSGGDSENTNSSQAGSSTLLNSVPDTSDEPSAKSISKEDIKQMADVNAVPLSNVTMIENDTVPDEEFYENYCNYAAELFKASCTEELKEGKNVLISPESVMMALGMTANGAKGETLTQMENGLGGTPIDKLNDALQYRMTRFNNSSNVSFNVANSVWVRNSENDIVMNQDFCDKVKEFYDADSYLAPFDETTLNDINGWVSNETKGMVPSIIDNIPDDALVYLVNAIAFEGEWQTEYAEDQIHDDRIFTNSKGEEEQVTMMYSEEDYYIADEGVTGFIKCYKGMDYGFMALLPKEGTDLADFMESLDGEKLRNYRAKAGGEVNVCIPEFTYDYDNELSEELKAMGMEIPFSHGADFSDMADVMHDYFFISKVFHKTHIEVDREGTRAAAATAVEMKFEDAVEIEEPRFVYLDRPFAYAIVDMENGTPIFIGAVNTIPEQ